MLLVQIPRLLLDYDLALSRFIVHYDFATGNIVDGPFISQGLEKWNSCFISKLEDLKGATQLNSSLILARFLLLATYVSYEWMGWQWRNHDDKQKRKRKRKQLKRCRYDLDLFVSRSMTMEIHEGCGVVIEKKYGRDATNLGDEGGYGLKAFIIILSARGYWSHHQARNQLKLNHQLIHKLANSSKRNIITVP
ncbi:hypothetical protein M8C21_031955 [Ambrosia artemisiifolia]|uniref:Uncharacterized protein n=1 Tax=Ambrosia artemisiifolia TaxID=4212 RepID=A0AAD5GTR8_AMBAR|nr:hypothetical protein M8C21_031955 [Ambrosia artemisiifolia]